MAQPLLSVRNLVTRFRTGRGTVTAVDHVSFDVAAWADLWFYSNPVYVEVLNSTKVAGVK